MRRPALFVVGLLLLAIAGPTEAQIPIDLSGAQIQLNGTESSGTQECDASIADTHTPLLLAQSGCCSFHNGVCGCSSTGRRICCDGTLSPTCTCTPSPPSHNLTITAEPTGTPNPVTSGGNVQLTALATDSLGHSLSYEWSVLTCLTASSNGSFNNPSSRTPIWTAPINTDGFRRFCSIQVRVSDGQGLSQTAFVTQGIDPAPPPPPHTLTITAGPLGTPNPVPSGTTASLSVTAVDSMGHALGYAWAASCPSLPSSGTFNNSTITTPMWMAPTNETGTQQNCTVQATVNDGSNGLSRTASFVQAVAPAASPPLLPSLTVEVVASACTTCHSGETVAYHMAFTNNGPPFVAEVKGGARFPDGTILPLVNTVTTIPSGASTLPLVPSQALPAGLPTIDLGIEAAILEPHLGVTLSRHSTTLHLLP